MIGVPLAPADLKSARRQGTGSPAVWEGLLAFARWRRRPSLRDGAAALALLASLAVFVAVIELNYPVESWLLPRYVVAWFWTLVFALAALCAGCRLFEWLGVRGLWLGESLLLSFALGVVLFALGVFAAGIAGVLGGVFFVAWPVALVALGYGAGRRRFRALRRHGFGTRSLRLFVPRSLIEWLSAALLALSLLALYIQVVAPDNAGFDALWYHLPLASEYALTGAIRPRPDGWYLAAYPQLATLLYTFAFLEPLGGLYGHVTLAGHIEYAIFLATLPGIALLSRRVAPGVNRRFASAALFLFPGILLYDSGLVVGADHVLAFFAAPVALATAAAVRVPSTRRFVLVGALVAGAALTRYQALYFIAPAGLLLAFHAVRKRAFLPALAGFFTALVVSTPHWLKNLAFYGDPFYPLLAERLGAKPFHAGAADLVRSVFQVPEFTPQGPLADRLLETLGAVVTFSFVPRDIWGFHYDMPVFGSLFTLLVVPTLFAKRTRKLWLLVLGSHLGVFLWYFTNHQERFLQGLLPWLAAATAGMLARLWPLGPLARVGVGALVSFQLAWSGGFWFLKTHRSAGGSALTSLMDQVTAGFDGQRGDRFKRYGALHDVARKLGQNAVVMCHDQYELLGVQRRTLWDVAGFQGATDYLLYPTPRAAYQHLRSLGVTHLLINHSPPDPMTVPRLVREVRFYRTALSFSRGSGRWGSLELRRFARKKQELPPAPGRRVLVLGCDAKLPRGIYDLSRLPRVSPRHSWSRSKVPRNWDDVPEDVVGVFVQGDCRANRRFSKRGEGFRQAARFENGELFVRDPEGASRDKHDTDRDRDDREGKQRKRPLRRP